MRGEDLHFVLRLGSLFGRTVFDDIHDLGLLFWNYVFIGGGCEVVDLKFSIHLPLL
jgi:DUF971 family protein